MISSWVPSPDQQVSPAGYGLRALSIFLPLLGHLLQMTEMCSWNTKVHKGKRARRHLCSSFSHTVSLWICTAQDPAAHPPCCISTCKSCWVLAKVVIPRMQPQALCWQRYACSLLAPNSKPSNFGYLVYNPGEYPVQTWSISWIKAGRLWNSEQHRNEYIALRCRSREKQARICLQKT